MAGSVNYQKDSGKAVCGALMDNMLGQGWTGEKRNGHRMSYSAQGCHIWNSIVYVGGTAATTAAAATLFGESASGLDEEEVEAERTRSQQ